MEHKMNLSDRRSRKSRSPQLTRKNDASECASLGRCPKESLKKTNSTNPKLSGSTLFSDFDRSKGQSESFSGHRFFRRPSTASEGFEKETGMGEREISRSSLSCKSFPVGVKERKQSPVKMKEKEGSGLGEKKADVSEPAEGFGSMPLLSLAVLELEKMLEAMSSAREELRKKMIEEIRCEKEKEEEFAEGRVSLFEDFYGSTLEEIFQAWAHLLYFIINLRINLIRLLSSAGAEEFEPKTEVEKEVIVQAIECAKLFSKMKLKSIGDSLEEFCLPIERGASETQINKYEERLSSCFLFEMNFVRKKAKEILKLPANKKAVQ